MSIYLGLPLIALLSNVGLAILTLRGQWQARGRRAFAFFLLAMAAWGGLLYMMRSSESLADALFWDKLVIIDVALVSVLYLHFTFGFSRQRTAVWVMPLAYLVLAMVAISTMAGLTVTGMQAKSYGYAPILGPTFMVFFIGSYGSILLGAMNVWRVSHLGDSPAIRNRAGYILAGTTASLVGGVTDILPTLGLAVYPLGIVGNVAFAAIATVAMLKVRLLDIRLALRRAFAYGVVAAAALAAYFGLAFVLEAALGANAGQPSLVFNIAFAGAAVVAVPLLTDRMQRWVDRTFLGNRYSDLKALETFSEQMKHAGDNKALAESLAALLVRATGAEFVAVLVPDETDDAFHTAAAVGVDVEFELPFGADASVLARLAAADKVMSAEEVSLFPEWQAVPDEERAKIVDANTKLFVPVMSQGSLVAVIVLGTQPERPYSQEEIDLLRTVANQAATALENARLYDQLAAELSANERRVAAFELAAGRMAVEENPDTGIEQLVEEVMTLLDATFGGVAVWSPSGDLTRVIGPGLSNRNIRDSYQDLAPWVNANGTVDHGLAIPFQCKDSGRGVFYLRDKVDGEAFTDADERLVNLFAALIGVLINNVEVYRAESRERSTLTAIQASMTEGIAVLDSDGSVLYFNRAAEHHWSMTANTVIGKDFLGAIGEHAEDFEEPQEAMEQLTALIDGTSEFPAIELAVAKPDRRDLAMATFPISTETGDDMMGLLVRDVTEERDLDRRRDTFVSVASHELRTPMTTILGFTELLLDDIPDGDAHRWLEHVHEDSLRLTRILDDMLDVSRIQSGRVRMTIERIDVADLVEEVIEGIGSTTDIHEFDVQVADGISKALTDHAKTTQIVLNLISNAIKYSPGGGKITVTAVPSESGDEILVRVTDAGIGIAPEDVDRVFDTFYRVKNEETYEIRGTGLGLYIVKSLVEGIGGTMGVESELGQGSTFWFTLPAAQLANGMARREPSEQQSLVG